MKCFIIISTLFALLLLQANSQTKNNWHPKKTIKGKKIECKNKKANSISKSKVNSGIIDRTPIYSYTKEDSLFQKEISIKYTHST